MKLFFVSPGCKYTQNGKFEQLGSESVILGLSKEFIKKGYEVIIAGRFEYFNETEQILDGIRFINIKSIDFHDRFFFEIGSNFLYSNSVTKIIKKENPDVVILNERFSAFYPSKLDIPKIFTTHNPDAMNFYKVHAVRMNPLNIFLFPFKNLIEKKVMRNSNVVVCLNEFIKINLFKEGIKNTRIIPNAIDLNYYFDADDKNYVLYAGRLDKNKGVEYLLYAFSQLYPHYNYKLIIIGSGPEEQRLKKIAKDIGLTHNIEFVPLVPKLMLPSYLANCSVFVLPSIFECMPITLLEAMASGKSVISSNIPGPKDIITHGYDGFLFEKENVGDLKRHLELCLSDKKLRKNIGNNARKTIEEKYVFEKIADSYIELFSKIYSND